MLFELSYISETYAPMTDADLQEILEKSRRNNKESGITGLLLYRPPLFIQLLEGPKEAVLATYERIKKDPRHGSISGLIQGDTKTRSFENWQMGFKTPKDSEIRQIEGFSDFLESSWTLSELTDNPTRSHRLLMSFREQRL